MPQSRVRGNQQHDLTLVDIAGNGLTDQHLETDSAAGNAGDPTTEKRQNKVELDSKKLSQHHEHQFHDSIVAADATLDDMSCPTGPDATAKFPRHYASLLQSESLEWILPSLLLCATSNSFRAPHGFSCWARSRLGGHVLVVRGTGKVSSSKFYNAWWPFLFLCEAFSKHSKY